MNTVIKIIENGPAIVKTEEGEYSNVINVEHPDGTHTLKSVIAICRCGKSKDGLFCDGSHKNIKPEEI